MSKVQIKILPRKGCEDLVPAYAHDGDAAMDLRTTEDGMIPPHETVLIPVGFYMSMPKGWVAKISPRSGIALKHSIMFPNSPGLVDAGYRGEVGVIAHNLSDKPYHYKSGERIGQMMIEEVPEVSITIVKDTSELGTSERGEGGFGSTGRY